MDVQQLKVIGLVVVLLGLMGVIVLLSTTHADPLIIGGLATAFGAGAAMAFSWFTGNGKGGTPAAAVLLVSGAILLGGNACSGVPTSQQTGAISNAACTLVAAFGGTPEEESICATAADLAQIAVSVATAQADAGSARKVVACHMIPTTNVCATDAELAPAIRARKATR